MIVYRRVYHSLNVSREAWFQSDDWGGLAQRTLCGDMYHTSQVLFPAELMEEDRPRCEKCLNHPDLPLLVLRDMEETSDD